MIDSFKKKGCSFHGSILFCLLGLVLEMAPFSMTSHLAPDALSMGYRFDSADRPEKCLVLSRVHWKQHDAYIMTCEFLKMPPPSLSERELLEDAIHCALWNICKC